MTKFLMSGLRKTLSSASLGASVLCTCMCLRHPWMEGLLFNSVVKFKKLDVRRCVKEIIRDISYLSIFTKSATIPKFKFNRNYIFPWYKKSSGDWHSLDSPQSLPEVCSKGRPTRSVRDHMQGYGPFD